MKQQKIAYITTRRLPTVENAGLDNPATRPTLALRHFETAQARSHFTRVSSLNMRAPVRNCWLRPPPITKTTAAVVRLEYWRRQFVCTPSDAGLRVTRAPDEVQRTQCAVSSIFIRTSRRTTSESNAHRVLSLPHSSQQPAPAPPVHQPYSSGLPSSTEAGPSGWRRTVPVPAPPRRARHLPSRSDVAAP